MAARKQKDYSKGKIYIIRNTENDQVYIGSTCQSLAQRMAQHRIDKNKHPSYKLYQAFTEMGIDKFYIELIEDYPCERSEQLLAREGHFIRQHNSIVDGYNKVVSGRTNKEYREDNKEKIAQQQKEWFKNNPDKRKQYDTEKRIKHYDKVRERERLYKSKNKEKIMEKRKEKVICECGCEMSKSSLSRHLKRQIHSQLMAQIQTN